MRRRAEEWQFPPAYDDAYTPSPDQPFWFPHRETMPESERESLIVKRIQEVMAYAYEHSAFYRHKWEEAGIHPSKVTSLEDFESVPVVTKDEIRADQERNEPFGSYLCVDESDVAHVHGTSGTTGRPTAFGISERDWRAIANAHARIMWSMGIRPDDTVFIGSFFSLYLGSWGALIGAERLGARVFPFGAGVPGQTARAVQWMKQMRPTVFYGTPSYALRIAEVAREHDVDPRTFGLRRLFFSGEPGASVPSIRRQIEEDFGAEVFDSGSMAEVSPWMNLGESTAHIGPLCWQDVVYTEICDPTSLDRVSYGREGTPVYTTLERTSQPMIRLVSNDLARWEGGPSPCGRTYPHLPRGVYGRIDEMFTIRGENVYPSAVDEVLREVPHYGGEHRILITRERTMDELTVQVEHDEVLAAKPEGERAGWSRQVADALRTKLGVGAVVVPMSPNTFERTEFKARRVVDDRHLLDQARQRLSR